MIADGECFAVLAPPKPKPAPVLREAFLHLYADGGVAVTYVRTSAAPAVEVRHEKWMSDGSPVQGEDDYVGMMGPVKSCNNCRFDCNGICARTGKFGFDANGDCQDWETKND
jgi:hypothetical protein